MDVHNLVPRAFPLDKGKDPGTGLGYAPAIHAASHVDHEKRVAWVSSSVHACGSVPIVMVLRLAVLGVAGAPLLPIFINGCYNHVIKKTAQSLMNTLLSFS